MQATAGRLVYETLRAHGVAHIFGMEDPIHLFHAVDPAATRIVTIHDERHAAMMAHGLAQATGRPGVCAATYGPGAANLAGGLVEAARASVPVIALSQDHPLRSRGRHANSELDHAAVFAPVAKAVLRIDYPDQAGDRVRAAFRIACSGRPGPVVILCPTDVMAAEGEADVTADPRYCAFPALRPVAGAAEVEAALDLLCAAARPLIVAGGGAMISGALAEVRALAEALDCPVATTLTGRGIIADDHPLALGAIGGQTGGQLGRGRAANLIAGEADTVLLLGTKTGQLAYSDWKLFAPGVRLIHLDIDPLEPGRNFASDCVLPGDVRDTLRLMLDRLAVRPARPPAADRGRLSALRAEWAERNQPYVTSAAVPIRPERLIAEVNAALPAGALAVCDGSYASGWTLSHVDIRQPGRSILSPRGTGSIGWAFAAALGARLGAPERPVLCVIGDGGFYYQIGEIETAVRHGIGVVTVVLNNGTLGFQRHYEQLAFGSYRDCDFAPTDFAAIARAMGATGERVTEPAALAEALARAFAGTGPTVLDVVIDPAVAAPVPGFEFGMDLAAGH